MSDFVQLGPGGLFFLDSPDAAASTKRTVRTTVRFVIQHDCDDVDIGGPADDCHGIERPRRSFVAVCVACAAKYRGDVERDDRSLCWECAEDCDDGG